MFLSLLLSLGSFFCLFVAFFGATHKAEVKHQFRPCFPTVSELLRNENNLYLAVVFSTMLHFSYASLIGYVPLGSTVLSGKYVLCTHGFKNQSHVMSQRALMPPLGWRQPI